MREGVLKASLRTPYRIAAGVSGLDLRRTLASIRGIWRFTRNLSQYRARARGPFAFKMYNVYPILADFEEKAGTAEGDYFHQDLWAARKIYLRRPARHVDIGSRIDGFISHLLVFTQVEVIDIRPLQSTLPGLTFIQADGATLEGFEDDSLDSLSSLHAVEHFGLGRYGDPVDPDAALRAMVNFARVLRRNGRLYFSVPIGRERVEFNAHRIFAPQTILDSFPKLTLVSFSAVDDSGSFRADCTPADFSSARMACGLFEFTK
jgi:SAM-dependent methyltransferase